MDFFLTRNRKILFENFTALSVLQMANYALPLITLPYLVRVLSPDRFGLIAFAQAIIQYFVLFTDFGFNFSAVREISINRENKNKVSEIFCTVYFIKTVLTIISFLILVLAVIITPKLKSEWLLYLLMYGIVIGNMLFPIWFFQGIECMKYVTALNVSSKLIFTVLVFGMIRQESDYIIFPVISSLGYIVAGVTGFWIAVRKYSIQLIIPTREFIISQLKISGYFFASRVCLALYSVSNTVLLGIFTTNEITGFYAAAEKLIRAIEGMNQPIINTLYPYIAKTRNKRLYKYAVYMGGGIGCIAFIILILFSQEITQLLYGKDFQTTAHILQLYAIDLTIVFPSGLIGLPILAAFGHIRYLNYTNVLGFIIYVIFIVGMALILSELNVYLIVVSIILSEATVLISRIAGLKKYSLW